VSGQAIGGRANNVSGFVIRPQCQVVDNTNTIISHTDCSAIVVGGSAVWGNTTGFAIVAAGGTETTQVIITCGTAGIPAAISNGGAAITNNTFLDFLCYDLGCRNQELYGAFLPVPNRQSFSAGGAYVPNYLSNTGVACSQEHNLVLTANVAVTISNPNANPTIDRNGRLRFLIFNNSGGALTTPISFTGNQYKSSGTVNPGNGQTITVEFTFDFNRTLWLETFRSAAV
jgi:hypothetical protein